MGQWTSRSLLSRPRRRELGSGHPCSNRTLDICLSLSLSDGSTSVVLAALLGPLKPSLALCLYAGLVFDRATDKDRFEDCNISRYLS